eukprot:3426439-Pyramimonas_sp.AAC.1
MKFEPIERWASRPTTLRVAPRVEPLAPRPVAILRDVARREGPPGRPRGPVAEPIVVLQVSDIHELAAVVRDVHPAVGIVAP